VVARDSIANVVLYLPPLADPSFPCPLADILRLPSLTSVVSVPPLRLPPLPDPAAAPASRSSPCPCSRSMASCSTNTPSREPHLIDVVSEQQLGFVELCSEFWSSVSAGDIGDIVVRSGARLGGSWFWAGGRNGNRVEG
jgi:hypothetical protein